MGPLQHWLPFVKTATAFKSQEILFKARALGSNLLRLSTYLTFQYRGGSRGRVQRVHTPPPSEMTCSLLIQLVFCKKKNTMWFTGVEVEQETSVPPPKKIPGSAPAIASVEPTLPSYTIYSISLLPSHP